jgi:DNA-directed RNA polymerase subunit RPC12/RpoP
MIVGFKCTKCKYEFKPRGKDKQEPPKRCPYCGTEGSVTEKRHILEEI